jgi:hypothetical protein
LKNIIKTLFIIALFILIYSCSSSVNTEKNNQSSEYFPLEVGNQWEYYYFNNDTLTHRQKILEEISIDGKKYFIRGEGNELSSKDTLRFYDDVICIRENGFDRNWFDFSKDNNERYKLGKTEVLVEKNLKITTKAGEFNDCVGFHFNDPKIYDDEISYYFAKGVGIVQIKGAWVNMMLREFKVN